MMHRLTAILCYASHNDVAHFIRNDAMFAMNISEAASLGAAVIIRETTSFAERQTSFATGVHHLQ